MSAAEQIRAFLLELDPREKFAFLAGYHAAKNGHLPDPRQLDFLRVRAGLRTAFLYCERCGRPFPRTGKRGHPAKRCPTCRGVS